MWRQVLVFWVFLWCSRVSAAQQCSSPKSESLNFSVSSRRNQTGHWIGEVILDHGADEEDPALWNVDVSQITTLCEGKKSVSLKATLTAPLEFYKEGAGVFVNKTHPGQMAHKKLDSLYQLVPGLGYYKFHPIKQPWHSARELCATEGTHMLVLNSDKEWTKVKEMWDKHRNITSIVNIEYLHYGMTDFLMEANFVTIFGDPIHTTGYTKWIPGEPNSGNTANCGALRKDGGLCDSHCTNQFPFVCELEL